MKNQDTVNQGRGERGTEMDMDWVYYGFVQEITWSGSHSVFSVIHCRHTSHFIGFVRKKRLLYAVGEGNEESL